MTTKRQRNAMNNLLKSFFCIMLVAGLTACSQSETGTEGQTNEAQGITITAETSLDNNVEEMVNAKQMVGQWDAEQTGKTRTTISYDRQGNLKFNWETGKIIPIFVYITDGNNHGTVTVSGGMKIVSANRGRFSFNVPAQYNLDNLKIAVVTGKENGVENGAWATGMSNDGVVSIGTPEAINTASYEYNIPLYAKLTPVEKASKTASLTFSMLGNWIGVRAKSDMYFESNVYSIAIVSDVLHMDGNLNVSKTTPEWTPGNYRIDVAQKETSDAIKTKNFVIGGAASGLGTTKYTKPFYVWAKATPGKTSVQKAKVIIRSEADTEAGPVYKQEDKYSTRNKFYREAKQVVQFEEGDTYNFGIDASLKQTDGGLILTEYYHSTLTGGEYNWIEITNATRETISLKDYYLVSPGPENNILYVDGLTNLQNLCFSGGKVVMTGNSTTSIPAGRSICLGATQIGSGVNAVKANNTAYQIIDASSAIILGRYSSLNGGIRFPKYICKGGYNIDFNDPNNNIVDNLGTRVIYNPSTNNFETYFYYMGNVSFFRSRERGFNVPQKKFLAEVWNYRTITWKYLGTFNDLQAGFAPLSGYNGGQTANFVHLDRPMSYYIDVKYRP